VNSRRRGGGCHFCVTPLYDTFNGLFFIRNRCRCCDISVCVCACSSLYHTCHGVFTSSVKMNQRNGGERQTQRVKGRRSRSANADACGATSPGSTMSSDYYAFVNKKGSNEDEDEADDFMMRIMEGTCQGIFPDPTKCQAVLPACQARLEHQLDVFTVGSTHVCLSLCVIALSCSCKGATALTKLQSTPQTALPPTPQLSFVFSRTQRCSRCWCRSFTRRSIFRTNLL
jgi:hypothetical protein